MQLYCDWKYNDCIETNEVNDDQEQEPRRFKNTAASIGKIKICYKFEDEKGVPAVE